VTPVLPEIDVARVRRWVEARNERIPAHARDKVRYELDVAPRHLTLLECRPPWRSDFGPEWTRSPIVRFHYAKAAGSWAVYWRDRNAKFHRFDPVAPSRHVEDLLRAVDEDRSGIFWG
jgi:hypothetical protein